jgi:sterol desaturase/sphingolipid hydroxylase (fatty acid hydroxylase superfamily)
LESFIPLVRRKSQHLFSNLLLAAILVLINFLFASITLLVGKWIHAHNCGVFNSIHINMWLEMVISLLFLDLWAGYIVHYLLHKFSGLWKFHSIHHSDDLVDVTTTFRQHPVETIIRIFFQLVGMLILGIPVWMLLFYLTISTTIAQVEHANISIPSKLDRWLQYIIVTPNMHKVHHSKYQHETDSNYSNIFSFWDKLFNTYKRRVNYRSIQYGLDYLETGKHYSVLDLLRLSFGKTRIKNHNIHLK